MQEIWRSQDEGDIGCGVVKEGNYVLYANEAGIVKALDARTGREVWRFATEGKVFSTPAIWKRRVIIGSSDGCIYCLSLKNGKLRWRYRCEKSVLASPVIQDGIAYVGSSDHVFRALKVRNGKLLWSRDGIAGFVECKPYIDREQLVFGDWANTLYSLDPKTGHRLEGNEAIDVAIDCEATVMIYNNEINKMSLAEVVGNICEDYGFGFGNEFKVIFKR